MCFVLLIDCLYICVCEYLLQNNNHKTKHKYDTKCGSALQPVDSGLPNLILIAFITGNSSLEPLIEGLCAQIHMNLRWRVFGRNRTGDLTDYYISWVPRSPPLSYGDGWIAENPLGPSLLTAPKSVCVPDVIGALAVWIQNQKKNHPWLRGRCLMGRHCLSRRAKTDSLRLVFKLRERVTKSLCWEK